jgi:hypothetical protein
MIATWGSLTMDTTSAAVTYDTPFLAISGRRRSLAVAGEDAEEGRDSPARPFLCRGLHITPRVMRILEEVEATDRSLSSM